MTTRPSFRPATASALACLLLSLATAAFAQQGTITGTVTNAATTAAVPNITVEAYGSNGALAGTGFSNGAGQYSIALPAGTYRLKTAVFIGFANFADELYNNLPCSPTCTISTGTPVVVTAGGTTPGIDFSLTPGGTITGTITSASGGAPIEGVTVYAYTSSGAILTAAATNAAGQYTIAVPAGTYYLETVDAALQNFVDELYDNLTCRPSCAVTTGTAVTVTPSTSTTNINFVLAAGGAVTGTVTATGSGSPVVGARVGLYSTSGALVKQATTSGSGSYTIAALAAGSYRARTFTPGAFVDEVYNNQAICAPGCATSGGTAIAVSAGSTTSGVNFSLAASAELLQNGGFSSGLANWLTFATPTTEYIQSSLVNGIFFFRRVPPPPGTSNQAVVFQNTGLPVASGTPLFAQLDAGQLSGVYKRISVLVHDADFSDLAVCTFWLPPTAPPARYGIRLHTTKAWTNASISIYAASTGAANEHFFIDNVSLQTQPSANVERTDCIDPAGVAAPGGANGANLVVNGDFASGSVSPGWTTFGQIQSNVTGGVFQFIKLAGTPAGVLLQPTNQAIASRDILTATMDLGNSSAVRKRVTVLVHDNDFSDLAACTFWLPPGQALSSYTMRLATNEAWTNATISIYPATTGSDQWIRLDNVTLRRTPSTVIAGTECVETSAGGDEAPGVQSPSAQWSRVQGSGVATTTAGAPAPADDASTSVAVPESDDEWVADGFERSGEAAPGEIAPGWTAESDGVLRTLTTRSAFEPALAGTRLIFQSWLSAAGARVEVRAADGAWETVRTIGASDTWIPVEVDLSGYAGNAIHIRLVLDPAGAAARWTVGDLKTEN